MNRKIICYSKDCKQKSFVYDNYAGERLESCFDHKPMGWKRTFTPKSWKPIFKK